MAHDELNNENHERNDSNAPGIRGLGVRVTIRLEPEQPEHGTRRPIPYQWIPTQVDRHEYDAYGLLPESCPIFVEAAKDDYRWEYDFGGHRPHEDGLLYFGTRDFSPALGRWLEDDQTGYVEGANMYRLQH